MRKKNKYDITPLQIKQYMLNASIRDVEAVDFSTASTASASASILQYKY